MLRRRKTYWIEFAKFLHACPLYSECAHMWGSKHGVHYGVMKKVDASAAGVSVLAFGVTTMMQKQQGLWRPWSSTVTHGFLPKDSWVFWPQSFKKATCLSSRCRRCCGFSCLHTTKNCLTCFIIRSAQKWATSMQPLYHSCNGSLIRLHWYCRTTAKLSSLSSLETCKRLFFTKLSKTQRGFFEHMPLRLESPSRLQSWPRKDWKSREHVFFHRVLLAIKRITLLFTSPLLLVQLVSQLPSPTCSKSQNELFKKRNVNLLVQHPIDHPTMPTKKRILALRFRRHVLPETITKSANWPWSCSQDWKLYKTYYSFMLDILTVHTWEAQKMVCTMAWWKKLMPRPLESQSWPSEYQQWCRNNKDCEGHGPQQLHTVFCPRILGCFDHNPSRKPLASAAGAAGAAASVACTQQKTAWHVLSFAPHKNGLQACNHCITPATVLWYDCTDIAEQQQSWAPLAVWKLVNGFSPRNCQRLKEDSFNICLCGWSLLHGFSLGLEKMGSHANMFSSTGRCLLLTVSHCFSHRLFCWCSWCLSCLPEHAQNPKMNCLRNAMSNF